jgi:catechol 2,3-dioxygenase
VRRLIAYGVPLSAASDHGICESVYVKDPDGNRVEVYWDRPDVTWPRTKDGRIAVIDMSLDLADLLAEVNA